jgi:hypothetical protein
MVKLKDEKPYVASADNKSLAFLILAIFML